MRSAKGAEQVPDPPETLLEGAVTAHADGRMVEHTDEARRLIFGLRLNDPDAIRLHATR